MHDFSVIIGADMNTTLSDLDRSHKRDQYSLNASSKAFQGLVSDYSLVDLFRAFNRSARQYTFFSNRHKTFSRIDYLLASPSAFSQVQDVKMHLNPISDHRLVTAQIFLKNTQPKATRWRLNTTLLANNDFSTYFRREIHENII